MCAAQHRHKRTLFLRYNHLRGFFEYFLRASCLHFQFLLHQPQITQLTSSQQFSYTTNMPKEPVASKTRGKGKATKASEKKKKGEFLHVTSTDRNANIDQTPTPPSVVFLRTCSSPTSSAIRSARKTLASSSVRSLSLHRPETPC